jgi:hypothetical protein
MIVNNLEANFSVSTNKLVKNASFSTNNRGKNASVCTNEFVRNASDSTNNLEKNASVSTNKLEKNAEGLACFTLLLAYIVIFLSAKYLMKYGFASLWCSIFSFVIVCPFVLLQFAGL